MQIGKTLWTDVRMYVCTAGRHCETGFVRLWRQCDNVVIVRSSCTSITRVHLMNVEQQLQAANLCVESWTVQNLYHIRHRHLILLNPKADSHFTTKWRTEGWTDLGDWLYTKMVYLPGDRHPSQYYMGPAQKHISTVSYLQPRKYRNSCWELLTVRTSTIQPPLTNRSTL